MKWVLNLLLGCISLGGAFTYYQKQRADRIDASLIEKKGIDVNQSAQEETNQNSKEAKKLGKPAVSDAPKKSIDYQQVYNNIAELLDNDSE